MDTFNFDWITNFFNVNHQYADSIQKSAVSTSKYNILFYQGKADWVSKQFGVFSSSSKNKFSIQWQMSGWNRFLLESSLNIQFLKSPFRLKLYTYI